MPKLLVINVARKPLSEPTVAKNVLKHGVGALNIDACRISTGDMLQGGRWPPNLILQHKATCKRDGVKQVKGGHLDSVCSSNGILFRRKPTHKKGYADKSGTETVDAWECAPGCPVAEIDIQSGDKRGGFAPVKGTEESAPGFSGGWSKDEDPHPFYGDTGGASRFFKQFRSNLTRKLSLPRKGKPTRSPPSMRVSKGRH